MQGSMHARAARCKQSMQLHCAVKQSKAAGGQVCQGELQMGAWATFGIWYLLAWALAVRGEVEHALGAARLAALRHLVLASLRQPHQHYSQGR